MLRAVIIHCWGGKPHYAWYPWLEAQLVQRGYSVSVPKMPHTHEPRQDKWLSHVAQVIGEPDDDLVLIGHSLGTVIIMRYLESLSDKQKIGKAILVAGFTDQLGFGELDNFFESTLNYKKIKSKSVHGFAAIQSDDDPHVSEQYSIRLQHELGAKLIIKHGARHMSGAIGKAGSCIELPEVLRELR
jgi:predicted alpha/beta hydrolase family esterase